MSCSAATTCAITTARGPNGGTWWTCRSRRTSRACLMALPPGPRTPSVYNLVRFGRRPIETLQQWHRRYGDAFTVSFLGLGKGVYVSDPQAIKALFTGDQSDLRAGQADSVLSPIIGPHLVLTLDGAEHLRPRKLFLPPFQGSRGGTFRSGGPGPRARASVCWRRSRARGWRTSARSCARSRKARSTAGSRDRSSCCASGCARSRLT